MLCPPPARATIVAWRTLVRFVRDIVTVLFWAGTWSLVLPDPANNAAVVWVCFGIGTVGNLGFIAYDAFVEAMKERAKQRAVEQKEQITPTRTVIRKTGGGSVNRGRPPWAA